MDPSTDCMGDGGYEVGKTYLVYAGEREVKDIWLTATFCSGGPTFSLTEQRSSFPIPLARRAARCPKCIGPFANSAKGSKSRNALPNGRASCSGSLL